MNPRRVVLLVGPLADAHFLEFIAGFQMSGIYFRTRGPALDRIMMRLKHSWVLLVPGGILLLLVGSCTQAEKKRCGNAKCAECHAEHMRFLRHGGHKTISCESCHGPGGDHVLEEIEPRPEMIIYGREHCLQCHLKGAKGPESIPRIKGFKEHLHAIEEHHLQDVARALKRGKCVFCHDPHSLE
jgi:hypothetical protein